MTTMMKAVVSLEKPRHPEANPAASSPIYHPNIAADPGIIRPPPGHTKGCCSGKCAIM